MGSRTITDLTRLQVLGWGAVGGLLSVAANGGLFDIEKVQAMLVSKNPTLQIATYIVVSLVIVFVGAVWARAHYPIKSALVALQLGIIAPAAINALIEQTPEDFAKNLKVQNSFIISSAHASRAAPANLITQSGNLPNPSSHFRCIILAVVKKPC